MCVCVCVCICLITNNNKNSKNYKKKHKNVENCNKKWFESDYLALFGIYRLDNIKIK